MLTEEQINSLKKGDKVLAEASFIGVYKDNDLVCKAPFTNNTGDIICGVIPFHSSCLTLPPTPPKYDPCRRFKAGDKVRVVERYGRTIPDGKTRVGDIVTIAEDEDYNLFMYVFVKDGSKIAIPWFFLELVTPVEERIPYVIDPANTNIILRYGQKFAEFEDDDAAEACCRMLNADWRKYHENHD